MTSFAPSNSENAAVKRIGKDGKKGAATISAPSGASSGPTAAHTSGIGLPASQKGFVGHQSF